jgi:hypothetical protein
MTEPIPDPEVPQPEPSADRVPNPSGPASQLSNRDRKLLERLSVTLGEPAVAAHRFWVEGSYPWYLLGIVVGIGILQGALGAVLGIGLGYVLARLITYRRAPGLGQTSLVALTPTRVIIFKGTRPTGSRLGEWPVNRVRASWRRKRLTNAFTFDLPDGRHVRLESWGFGARKGADNLVAHLRSLGALTDDSDGR